MEKRTTEKWRKKKKRSKKSRREIIKRRMNRSRSSCSSIMAAENDGIVKIKTAKTEILNQIIKTQILIANALSFYA